MSRFASRFPANFSRPFYMLSMLLPGTPIIYYGDELGMTDLQATTEHVTTGLMQWENSTNAGWNCTNDCYNGVNSDFSTINVAVRFQKILNSDLLSNIAFFFKENYSLAYTVTHRIY